MRFDNNVPTLRIHYININVVVVCKSLSIVTGEKPRSKGHLPSVEPAFISNHLSLLTFCTVFIFFLLLFYVAAFFSNEKKTNNKRA